MQIDIGLQEVEAALERFEDVEPAVCALLARAGDGEQRLRIHARLADLFERYSETDSAAAHARLAVSDAESVRDQEDAALVARAIDIQAMEEDRTAGLHALVSVAARLADSWPSELGPALLRLHARLAARLLPGAEAEANARAWIARARQSSVLDALSEAESELARIRVSQGDVDEAAALARAVIERSPDPRPAAVQALGVLSRIPHAKDDAAHRFLDRALAMARGLDDVPESDTRDVWDFLLEDAVPTPAASDMDLRARAASYGPIDDPQTLDAEGNPSLGGILSERIFGPLRDGRCRCGAYASLSDFRVVCERCSVEVRTSRLRRWRFGHISLALPVDHPRYVAGLASQLGASDAEIRYQARRDAPDPRYEPFCDALSRVGIKVLPVPPPDADGSPLRDPAVRRAYERVLVANAATTGLQAAVDDVFAALDRWRGRSPSNRGARSPEAAMRFFNRLSGVLEIQLAEAARSVSERVVNPVAGAPHPTTRVQRLSGRWQVLEQDELRDLSDEESDRVVIAAPTIQIRSASGEVVNHAAPDGVAFSVRALAAAIEETERRTRDRTEWPGGVDVHHLFFEGLNQSDGVWVVRWGS